MAKYGTFKYGNARYGTGGILWTVDRTQADIDNNTKQAYINYWDLNRIETRIGEILVHTPEVSATVKTDWVKQTSENNSNNFPTAERLNRIVDTILTLCGYYGIKCNINTMELLTIDKMNNFEKTLRDIYRKMKEAV